MDFHIVHVTVPSHTAEAIGETFWQAGVQGIEIAAETGATTTLRAYFSKAPLAANLLNALEQTLAAFDEDGLHLWDFNIERRPYEDWLAKWKADWVVQSVGQRWLIVPPWRRAEAEAVPEWKDRLRLVIEPGMAFGTGTHATTRACLMLLEQLPTTPQQVLDVGTGTGILAIAAAKLFPQAVCLACDIDLDAVTIAAANVQTNGVGERIPVRVGSVTDYSTGQVDLVIANLTAEVIISLASDLARVLRPEGYLITAGVLSDRQTGVVAAMTDAGFDLQRTQTDGEWWAGLARRCLRDAPL
ncbi:MAG: 50S ribosomal protein L11 methyltransferase [Acidobacteriota bacterium]